MISEGKLVRFVFAKEDSGKEGEVLQIENGRAFVQIFKEFRDKDDRDGLRDSVPLEHLEELDEDDLRDLEG